MELNQTSFKGGMNLLVDDTRPTADLEGNTSTSNYRIAVNQYRIGFNVRCRYDVLEPILSSQEDMGAPTGIKQALVTFGDYLILFVNGAAFYRSYAFTGWSQINDFSMSTVAPRYWTIAIPVSETLFARVANPVSSTQASTTAASSSGGIDRVNVSGAFQGNLPGLLVQDGINQPQFIYLDSNGNPQCKVTQTYNQWDFQWISDLTSADYGTVTVDKREYVPIGTYMEIYNGILFIVSQDGENIYRSVSGRHLDFVVNVDINGDKGGDATTTSYSVGVGGINCIKNLSGGLFVSTTGNACFNVTINTTPNAPTIFGEYTFIRTFLFTASCITDRAIMDINGDTAFVDVTGLRSFNSILQSQNEGRNSVFSKTVSSLFQPTLSPSSVVVQNPTTVACVTYNNYAIFAVNTIYGNINVVYDTISQVYNSLDINQYSSTTSGIKQFAAIYTEITALFAITTDDRVIQLYCGGDTQLQYDTPYVRFMSVCAQDPEIQVKQTHLRAVLSQFSITCEALLTTFVDNRMSGSPQDKSIQFAAPQPVYNAIPVFSDANSQVITLTWTTPNCQEGWKVWNVLSWTGAGKITNVKTTTTDRKCNTSLAQQNYVTQS
jgi:hypothetical protein